MTEQTTLAALTPGAEGKVAALRVSGAMRRRLQDIGLISGTHVRCVLRAPGGDPTAYAIRGAVVALRAEDAAGVLLYEA